MNEIASYLNEIRIATSDARVHFDSVEPSSENTLAIISVLAGAENSLRKAQVKTLSGMEKCVHSFADSAKELACLIDQDSASENDTFPILRFLIATYLGAIPVLMLQYQGRYARKISRLGWEIESMLSEAGMETLVSCNTKLILAIRSRLNAVGHGVPTRSKRRKIEAA